MSFHGGASTKAAGTRRRNASSQSADGFVAKGLSSLADPKGKTLVTQINGPHLSLIGNMLKDAGLPSGDVTIRFVRDITAAHGYDPKTSAEDPANAFRRDDQLAGAACISPDILALTAGRTVGTGLDGTVKGARAIFMTKTASNIIFDTHAVRRDFLVQEFFLGLGLIASPMNIAHNRPTLAERPGAEPAGTVTSVPNPKPAAPSATPKPAFASTPGRAPGGGKRERQRDVPLHLQAPGAGQ